ncbi:MAG: hypothetical protein CM1200mP3_04520 [Chloroflexota bacterium]|nr:MAG: hypothetical protein CM1200mP3_04520 [Chloroflexota bacterium]
MNGIGDGRSGDELALLPDEILTVQAAVNAKKHLDSGVTTIRDCGGKHNTTFLLRQSVEKGYRRGPKTDFSRPPNRDNRRPFRYFGTQATGEAECRQPLGSLLKKGLIL